MLSISERVEGVPTRDIGKNCPAGWLMFRSLTNLISQVVQPRITSVVAVQYTSRVYRPKIDPKLAFVLMPFRAPFDSYYNEIIRPAARLAGLDASVLSHK
jgi:hypothetical protein